MGGGVKRPEKHWKMDKPKRRLLWVAHLVQNLISNETIEIVCDLEWVLTTTLGASASLSEHERGGVARQSHAYACKWTCLSLQGCQLVKILIFWEITIIPHYFTRSVLSLGLPKICSRVIQFSIIIHYLRLLVLSKLGLFNARQPSSWICSRVRVICDSWPKTGIPSYYEWPEISDYWCFHMIC